MQEQRPIPGCRRRSTGGILRILPPLGACGTADAGKDAALGAWIGGYLSAGTMGEREAVAGMLGKARVCLSNSKLRDDTIGR